MKKVLDMDLAFVTSYTASLTRINYPKLFSLAHLLPFLMKVFFALKGAKLSIFIRKRSYMHIDMVMVDEV